MRLSRKVVKRYLLRKADAVGDPKVLIKEFVQGFARLEIASSDIEAARKLLKSVVGLPYEEIKPIYSQVSKANDISFSAYFKATGGVSRLSNVGHKLFISILQTYDLPSSLRKEVEKAVKFYMKPPKPRVKSRSYEGDLERLGIYETRMDLMRSHIGTALKAIALGKEHSEEGPQATKMKVGGFTLINTGGFPEKTMQLVADVVQKAQALLKSAGLGKVCYGDIQVTNTIHKSRALAFYLIADDALFIRANLKGDSDIVRTVLHELGHRYEHKFFKGSRLELGNLYYIVSGQERSRSKEIKAPEVGEELKSKGKTYRVTHTTLGPKGVKIMLELVGSPKNVAHISIEGWAALKGGGDRDLSEPGFKGFVTEYAKKNPSENFAEMFAYYCLGKLPKSLQEEFESFLEHNF